MSSVTFTSLFSLRSTFDRRVFYRILAIFFFCFSQQSIAGTPSYIGPYKYGSVPYHGIANSVSGAPSAEAAMQGTLENSISATPSNCAHRIELPTSPWKTTVYNASPIEGVEVSASTTFYLHYKSTCVNQIIAPYTLTRSRLVCASTQRYIDNKCVNVELYTPPAIKGANLGPSCPSCGEPINPSTGNMWHIEEDYVANRTAPGLTVQRVYNSYPFAKPPIQRFGTGWSDRYGAKLRPGPAYPTTSPYQCWRRTDTRAVIYCEMGEIASANIPESVLAYRGDGKSYLFRRLGSEWVAEADTSDRISANFSDNGTTVSGWTYSSASDNTVERFDAQGRLISIVFSGGTVHRLTYSSGDANQTSIHRYPADAPTCNDPNYISTANVDLPMCVTDTNGRQINYSYSAQNGLVTKIILPDGQSISYDYESSSGACLDINYTDPTCVNWVLSKVTYPDSTARTYLYNESNQINAGAACVGRAAIAPGRGHLVGSLTGLIDEEGTRYISWKYDCSGNATSSEKAGGVEKVTLAYIFWSTKDIGADVTYYTGDLVSPKTTLRRFNAQPILGVLKNNSINGACPECGNVASRSHDVNGNVVRSVDRNGTVTTYTYDLIRNLQISKTENSGGILARTTSTSWHPTLRLPLKIAEPNRISTYLYDELGNVLSLTEQASSDVNGTAGHTATLAGPPSSWLYTYDAKGRLSTVTGPRTAMVDTTSYEYDTSGDLATMRNAAGHTTSFGDYDAHGRVREIVAPNGIVTRLSYTSRGWLSARVVSAGGISESTIYNYTPTGKINKVTTPDGNWLEYSYDAAHRLKRVTDRSGRRVDYTLDVRGNVVLEETFDSSGALTNRVSRVFDEANRLTQQTGGDS